MNTDFQTFQSNLDLRILSGMLSGFADSEVLGESDWARVEELAADAEGPDFAPATAWLIRGALRDESKAASVSFNWECFEEDYAALRPDHRAILAVGFRRLGVPCPKKHRCSTASEQICHALASLAQAMPHEERDSIARSEGNDEWQTHFDALDKVIDEQDCRMTEDQSWYPAEALEICSSDPSRQGFWGATALLLIHELEEPDHISSSMWSRHFEQYLSLDQPRQAVVLAAFRHCYEASERWAPEFRGWRNKDPRRSMVAIPWAAPEYLIGARA